MLNNLFIFNAEQLIDIQEQLIYSNAEQLIYIQC